MANLRELSAREQLIDLLIIDDAEQGIGSERQLEAWRELEWRRCAASARYFIEKYGWLITKSGKVMRFNHLFPCQVETFELMEQGESLIQVKSRQLGQTTGISHYALWEVLFKEAVTWNFMGADEDASKDMKSRLSATIDRLPDWLKLRAASTEGSKADAKTVKSIGKPAKKNAKDSAMTISFGLSKIMLYSGGVNKAQGLSGKIFFDDFGKHTGQKNKWQKSLPTIDDAKKENRGQMVIIFNGNGEDFCFHLYQQAKTGELNLIPRFYSWRNDPRRLDEPILNDAGEVVSYEWYERTKRAYLIENPDSDSMAFRSQFPETEDEAFFLSDNSRFQMGVMNGMMRLARKLTFKQGRINADLSFAAHGGKDSFYRLYDHPEPGAMYVSGIDSAGGNPDGDASVNQILRILTEPTEMDAAYKRAGWKKDNGDWNIPVIDGEPAFTVTEEPKRVFEQVCVFDARCEPTYYGEQVAACGTFYNDALLVPETNNHGETVISRIKECGYFNFYRRMSSPDHYFEQPRETIGFCTTTKSKSELINILAEQVASGLVIIKDKRTLSELQKYRYETTDKGNTTTNAPKGQHDDHVMALALAVYGAVKKSIGDFEVCNYS